MSGSAHLIPHSAVQVQFVFPLVGERGQARPQGLAGAAHGVALARRNLLILELNVEFQGLEIENI